MPIKAYKYRIYPTKAQIKKFEHWLDICCELYNAALQERKDAWRVSKKFIGYYHQQNQVPELREIRTDLKSVHSQVLRDPLIRIERAFDAFFRRVKAGEKAGYPRFRPRSRYDSFTYPQSGFTIKPGKLRLSKIGRVKIKQHCLIEGKIKTATIIRSATGKWYACITAKVEAAPLEPSNETVGIDCGLNKLATLSTGETIDNPRFFRKDEKALVRAQRKEDARGISRKEHKKRHKVVTRIHERIANRRRNFAHQHSRRLVNRFGVIVFENLNIKGMLKNHCLAKSISDAAWGQLVTYTQYKAENAGRKCVQVSPRNTSRMCSGCGMMADKSLKVRVHSCSSCGLVLDRDHNAAINILRLGLESVGASMTQTLEAAPAKGAE